MRTKELINALAADTPAEPGVTGRFGWLTAASAVVVGAVVVLIGLRPDLPEALGSARVLLKPGAALLLLVPAVLALLELARPTGRPRRLLAALAASPILLLAAAMAELVILPRDAWGAATMGGNVLFCLITIGLLGLLPLAAMLLALRRGATTRPALTGAIAGLAGGSLTAAIYAAHCTDDSPLFVAVWYGIAVLIVTAIGAIAGRWVLRW